MRYVLGVLSAILLVGGLFGATVVVMQSTNRDLVAPNIQVSARPTDYEEYQKIDGSKLRDFDLTFDVTLAQPEDSVRALLNVQALRTAADVPYDNAYYVDLTRTGVTMGSFEGGIGRPLGSMTTEALGREGVHHVVLKRRTPWLTVVIDDRIVGMVQDETHAFGDLALGVHGADVAEVKVQPIASLYYSDNFMQDDAEKSHWTTLRGTWTINVVTNEGVAAPAMSVDAFSYRASSEETASVVTGETFWDNYTFSAAIKSVAGETIGLLAYYRSEKDYYLFTWDRRDEKDPARSSKQLIRMRNGEKTVLAESPGGFIPNQWYTLAVQVEGRTIRALIDGHEVCSVEDDGLVGGMIGLYAARTTQTSFDDILVHATSVFRDDMKTFPAGRWTVRGGEWTASGDGTLKAQSDGALARCVTGSALWQNYRVKTEMTPTTESRCGIDLYYIDENTYYEVTCQRGAELDTWTLLQHQPENVTTLDQAQTPSSSKPYHVEASVNRGRLTLVVDGKTLIETFNQVLNAGAVGLMSEPTVALSMKTEDQPVLKDVGCFGGLEVEFLREEKPLVTKNVIMEHERSMGDWSGLVTDWIEQGEKKGPKFQWHRGYFPGSSTLEVRFSKFDQPESTVRVVLNGDGQTIESGYRMVVGPKTEESKETVRTMRLYRGESDKAVAVSDLGAIQPGTVKLERVGGLLVGYVDGRAVLTWRDETPLTGERLGWSVSENVEVDPEDVLVSSPNVFQYNFTQAPADWRTCGGIWEVSNRWQCDPRWSFFSGRVRNDVASLWSKRTFNGDVTIEFYVGPKMDQERGRSYEYARDFNITIAADGKDLSSGYSFMLGAFDNTNTCIYRQNKLLKAVDKVVSDPNPKRKDITVIPRGGELHRRWLHVVAQKKGDTLRMYYERNLIIEVKAPEPLTGNRIAFWTKDCGFMLGKIIISCENAGEMESPDFEAPQASRSIYEPLVGAWLGNEVSGKTIR